MSRLPDFIIIGAMKCATTTLHRQLAVQPGIFMSTPKEPNFFSDGAIYQRGLEWYTNLFSGAPRDALCGESSTHYTKLPTYGATVERIRRWLPEARFIYVMRHPIDRLISHYIHDWSERLVDGPLETALETHTTLVDYGRYAMQLEPYLRAFGPDRVLPVFFDRLVRYPQGELERICRFLGYGGGPRWQAIERGTNASAQRLRTSPLRDALVRPRVLRELRRHLVPQSLRDWLKKFWMMGERPRLSKEREQRLKGVFDSDLKRLGDWLGIELTCDNFRAVTAERELAWSCLSARAADRR